MENPRVRVADFNFYYGAVRVLKNVSIDIPENMVTGIIGPSGCGKSTFLRSINRINDTITGARAEGSIILDGKNIYDDDIDVVEDRKSVV